MIYTPKYFWQDGVGAPADFVDYPLWIANYGVECPLIADPWPRWDFWQYTSSGDVAGVSGNVDRNVFNGTYEDLLAFAAPPVACGDGVCAGEENATCPDDCPEPPRLGPGVPRDQASLPGVGGADDGDGTGDGVATDDLAGGCRVGHRGAGRDAMLALLLALVAAGRVAKPRRGV
jgi:hypothetical protein